MKRSRFSEEQIVAIVREVEARSPVKAVPTRLSHEAEAAIPHTPGLARRGEFIVKQHIQKRKAKV